MTSTGWPTLFSWFDKDLPARNRLVCYRAVQDLAICESPPSSNRGPEIDIYNRRAGSPVGSFWCASWATAVWEDAGVAVPPRDRASCDAIVDWALKEGLWIPNDPVTREPKVQEGSLILYTNGNRRAGTKLLDAVHVGIAVRLVPYLMSLEGNAAFGGTFSNNGEAVVLKRVDLRRVYGFVSPRQHAA